MQTPVATYRLQLRPEFDFDAAAAVAGYLSRLGVSHLYASPYLQAAPGSAHGYDVVDPSRVNEELGGEAGHERLQAALAAAGLGQVLDIVPNHMAIGGPENRWWWDVLRNGPASRYASYFDVDWDPPEARLRNRVLMPVLGDHYGRELEAGDIRIEYDDGGFRVRYHDHDLPLAPRSLGPLLVESAERVDDAMRHEGAGMGTGGRAVGAEGGVGAAAVAELAFLGRTLASLPEPGVADAPARRRRQADLESADWRVRELLAGSEVLREAVEATLAAVYVDADRLDEVLRAQNYRLAYWRTAGQELDYRRFFDIDTLAGLRTEDPEVFDAVHERVLEWLDAGVLDGIRVDHPDGLRRPGEYFRRLREAAPGAWVVVEKILMPGESLPDWPVAGTTGYDLLNDVMGVLLDPAGEGPLTSLWTEWTGDERDFHEVVYEARHDVLREVLAADVNRLANIFVDLCEERRRYRDFTRPELREALVEVAANFPVYRTYVGEASPAAEREEVAGERDRRVIERAVAAAAAREPELPAIDGELLDFLRRILLGEIQDDEARGLRMRFQQLTGPVAAKGEEDTAFYRYHRLVALNEVGGDPGRWGLPAAAFHEGMARRAAEQPAGMTSLSTHDTKRSEDVRARLLVLAEMPEEWGAAVREWGRRAAEHWPDDVERDPAVEYLLFQTLVGAWPIEEERVAAYMEKATREAKARTSWTDPDESYDAAVRRFIAGIYGSGLLPEIGAFAARLVEPGRVVSLAQKLVQLMVPGVPDIYQGTEVWDLSLVDPDNRRAVDFAGRAAALGSFELRASSFELRTSNFELPISSFEHRASSGDSSQRFDEGPDPAGIMAGMDDGVPKLWVVREALRVRGEHEAAIRGGYHGLEASGAAAEHVLAFLRGEREGEEAVVVVVPRFPVRLVRGGGWRGTVVSIPDGEWRNVLTGESIVGGAMEVEGLLERFPVALLVRGGS